MKSFARQTGHRHLRGRLAALLCLLAWFAATPSLLPATVAALGMLDGQHRVWLAQREGKVTVVFHHENRAQAGEHHHSLLTNALTSLATSTDSTRDHTFAFAQTGAATAPVPSVLPFAASAELAPSLQSFILPPIPEADDAPALSPRPPPDALALVCLLSTTLLI